MLIHYTTSAHPQYKHTTRFIKFIILLCALSASLTSTIWTCYNFYYSCYIICGLLGTWLLTSVLGTMLCAIIVQFFYTYRLSVSMENLKTLLDISSHFGWLSEMYASETQPNCQKMFIGIFLLLNMLLFLLLLIVCDLFFRSILISPSEQFWSLKQFLSLVVEWPEILV